MGLTIVDITQRVADRYSYETVATPRMNRTIAAAVTWYNRQAPRERIDSLTTVANQAAYVLPTDCPANGIADVYWFPGVDFSEYSDLQEVWADAELFDAAKPSERIIAIINKNYIRRWQRGTSEVLDDDGTLKLYLIPTPTASGRTVYFEYGGNHVLNIGETEYETIPAEHLEVVSLLTIAELLEDQAFRNLPRPDYTDGLVTERRKHVPMNIRRVVKDLRREAKAELSRHAAVAV